MPSVAESLTGTPGQFAAAAQAGVDAISEGQTVTFTRYVRVVLPLDGYVFWVRADLVDPTQIADGLPIAKPGIIKTSAAGIATRTYGASYTAPAVAPTVTVSGSLHYATDQVQDEDQTYAQNDVIFTALSEVEDFNLISPTMMLIGVIDGVRFAFSQRGSFYQTAGLWHYKGASIQPSMQTQIIDSLEGFNGRALIVSNSLPIWLALNTVPAILPFRQSPTFPMYPSFVIPDNLRPPYGAIHILPDSLEAIQATPLFDRKTLSRWQLVSERVRITLYGLDNNAALDYLDFVGQYTLYHEDQMGIMNMPTVRDEKQTQNEINTLAMKKTIEFQVNYYQARLSAVARVLIQAVIPDFYIGGGDAPWNPVLPIAPPLSNVGEDFTVGGQTFDVEQSYA